MTDLYTTLLREEKVISYGATLHNIVPLTKENKGNKMKKVVITIDGIATEAIICNDLNVKYGNETINIDLHTFVVEKGIAPSPSVDGFGNEEEEVSTSSYELQGDDLDAFAMLSEFRMTQNKTEKIEGVTPTAVTIESELYNIQDSPSVQNASMDLMEREHDSLQNGSKVYNVSNPRFVFEDKDNFKLIETAVLYKDTE